MTTLPMPGGLFGGGLLSPDQRKQALGFGLLSAGGQMMQGGQPGLLGALGQGLQGFAGGYQNFADRARQDKLYDLQLRGLEREDRAAELSEERREQMADAVNKYLEGNGLPPEVDSIVRTKYNAGDYDGALQTASDYVMDQMKGGEAPKTVGGMMWDGSQFVPIPGYTDQASAIAAAGRPMTEVKLPPMETESQKALGKNLGDFFSEIQANAFKSTSNAANYERLGGLLSQIETGKFKGTTNELKKAAQSFGVDLNALGISDDVALVDAAKAISAELALQLRSPASGAGMPGAMSDQDRAFLQSMVASVETNPQAVPMMIEARLKLARRQQEMAQVARQYVAENGGLDVGLYDALAAYAEANPLFSEADKQRIGAMGAAAGSTNRVLNFDAQGNLIGQ